jgi:hypothetical protein
MLFPSARAVDLPVDMKPLILIQIFAVLIAAAGCGTDSTRSDEGAASGPRAIAPEPWPEAPEARTTPEPIPETTPEPTPEPTPAPIAEAEPNGWEGAATDLGSSGALSFSGVCTDGGDVDYFRIDAGTGPLALSLSWNEGEMLSDIDVIVFSDDLGLGEDTSYPPGDSPSELEIAIADPAVIYVEIDCYNNASPNLPYSGTLVIP